MKVLSATDLGEALAAWGAHEQRTRISQLRPELKAQTWTPETFVRRVRQPYVERIERVGPIATYRVDLEPTDLGRIRICTTGSTLAQWQRNPRQETWVQDLCKSERISGPLLVLQHAPDGQPQDDATLVLKDGFHRADAWRRHLLAGANYAISAHLVLTARPPVIG